MKFLFSPLRALDQKALNIVFFSGRKVLYLDKNHSDYELLANAVLNIRSEQDLVQRHSIRNSTQYSDVLLCRLGDFNKIDKLGALELGAKFTVEVSKQKISDIVIHCDYDTYFLASFLEGIKLRNYSFNTCFNYKKEQHELCLKSVTIDSSAKDLEKEFRVRETIAESTHFARDLVSMPPNYLTPKKFAEICKELEVYGVEVKIFNREQLRHHKMNALLAVAQGSIQEPYVATMEWKGDSSKDDLISFVGKGVTFDSGGLNIKPSGRSLSLMKYDMGGAAVVTSLLQSLARRKAKVNVVGVVGLVENMPSGSAQRPGDVVTSMSGQTIEIDNTDAEGRLVLADVLWFTQEFFSPDIIIDLATLTGAIQVALGEHCAGLFSNNDNLAHNIFKSGVNTNENVWRLPLNSYYNSLIDSDIADIKNTGRSGAGSITAAQFLQRFIQGDRAWCHIDIAGVNWLDTDFKLSPKGATGFGVRLLNDYLIKNYET